MKHFNKLTLSALALPIAVVPAIVTSCNKKDTVDANHLLTYYEPQGGERMYLPEPCHKATPSPIHYSKGEHTFVIKEIKSDLPIYDFHLVSRDKIWHMDKQKWSVKVDDKDQTDLWEIDDQEETITNVIRLKDETASIKSGVVSITVTLIDDCDLIPYCGMDE